MDESAPGPPPSPPPRRPATCPAVSSSPWVSPAAASSNSQHDSTGAIGALGLSGGGTERSGGCSAWESGAGPLGGVPVAKPVFLTPRLPGEVWQHWCWCCVKKHKENIAQRQCLRCDGVVCVGGGGSARGSSARDAAPLSGLSGQRVGRAFRSVSSPGFVSWVCHVRRPAGVWAVGRDGLLSRSLRWLALRPAGCVCLCATARVRASAFGPACLRACMRVCLYVCVCVCVCVCVRACVGASGPACRLC